MKECFHHLWQNKIEENKVKKDANKLKGKFGFGYSEYYLLAFMRFLYFWHPIGAILFVGTEITPVVIV